VKHNLRFAVGVMSLALFATCISASPAVPQVSKTVDKLIHKEMDQRKIPGLQIAILQHGRIVYDGAFGVENVTTKTPVTPISLFPINSISKAFTGVAIISLVEAGRLRLDAPVSIYLGGLPSAWKGITIHQLLSHMSGLPEIVNDNVQLLGGEGDANAWKEVQKLPLHFSPGSQFEYCQTNFVVLQKIIEKLSGMSYAQFILAHQTEVAGMTSTSVQGGPKLINGLVPTYTYLRLIIKNSTVVGVEKTKHIMLRHEDMPYLVEGAGGIVSTADDLARWVVALQAQKILKKRSSLNELWAPQKLNNGKYAGLDEVADGYAAGWPIVMRKDHPAYAPEGGERAAMYVYPKDDITVIVLTNLMGGSPQSFIDEIASFYIPGMSQQPRPAQN
jgi:CubicO group peptidase (beta-lactamase class C family)